MAKVHFIGGEKGGVGKSMTSRLLAQYYIDRQQPFLGFDSDASHGTFSRFYGEFASPVIVAEDDSLDGILETCEADSEQEQTRDLIIDLAAQTSTRLDEWIEQTDVFGLFNELGYQVYIWHVMDDGVDSIDLLERSLLRYPQPELQFVVVQNRGRGEDFSKFTGSQVYQTAAKRNAHFFELGKLHPKLTQKVDFANASFWSAAHNRQVMNIAERQRMKVWLKKNYSQLDHFLAE